MAIQTIYT
jgi:hypothetical protein